MRKTKSKILDAVRKTAHGLHRAGALDQITLCEFDRLVCPRSSRLRRSRSGESVKRPASTRPSSPVCSTRARRPCRVGRSGKRPAGTALKLLHLVDKRCLDVVA